MFLFLYCLKEHLKKNVRKKSVIQRVNGTEVLHLFGPSLIGTNYATSITRFCSATQSLGNQHDGEGVGVLRKE